MNASTILVVDDEVAIRDMLKMALEIVGYEYLEADNISDAYRLIVDQKPDLVLLDWMLPGGSGLELLQRLKRAEDTRELPVIMVTAKTSQDNVIQGLDVGADDYITKPFSPKEMLARIRALLRRGKGGAEDEQLQVANLVLDGASKRVLLADRILKMGPTEFRLLQFFMSNPERAFTRSQLLDRVWGANVYVEDRTVDVHIRRLRRCLEGTDKKYSKLIQTVRGTGYRFSSRGIAL